jgi:hypothetical protein
MEFKCSLSSSLRKAYAHYFIYICDTMAVLESGYKKTGNFVTQSMNTIISLVKVMVRSKFFLSFPKAPTQSCILLGNGPSLKTSLQKHPDFFKQHSLLCVNNFAITKEYSEHKPGYYVMLDPVYWIIDPPEVFKNAINDLQEKTTWPLQLFIPRHAAKTQRLINLVKQNSNIHIHYFNYTVFKGFNFVGNWFYKKNLAMPQSQNVLVASLFVAINTGFKTIYLTGADHTWHENLQVNDDNVLCIKDTHFYDQEQKVRLVPFQKDHHTKENFTVHEIFTAWAKAFYGYWNLNEYAKYRGVTVYNASEVSFIDAFQRLKL